MSSKRQLVKKCQVPVARSQKPGTRGKPFIIPIFLPHAGCPHQCTFCNQSSITATLSTPSSKDVRRQIENFSSFRHKQRRYTQIAFFGGNFLGIQPQTIKRLLTIATEYVTAGHAGSIRFSTRPDTVDRQRLEAIRAFPVTTIELGVQSMDDRVLKHCNRGHTAAASVKAVQRLQKHGYEVGVQMMVGLPGDNVQRLQASACKIARLKPDFIRIYPTVVLTGSPLAAIYQKGDYVPLGLAQAVRQVKDLYLYFRRKNIAVIRMGLQASEALMDAATLLAGPYHPAFGHLVYCQIFLDMAIVQLESANMSGQNVRLQVHPRCVSKMRGLKNGNMKKLSRTFQLQSIEIIPDTNLNEDQLTVALRS